MRSQEKIKSISEKIEALRGTMTEKSENGELIKKKVENKEEVEEKEVEKFP